jgi:hypothetical protein
MDREGRIRDLPFQNPIYMRSKSAVGHTTYVSFLKIFLKISCLLSIIFLFSSRQPAFLALAVSETMIFFLIHLKIYIGHGKKSFKLEVEAKGLIGTSALAKK